jgi:hypothetical protein
MIANTIDEVIDHLEDIIQTTLQEESTLGYFAALYQNVTISVKNKLGTNYFDDDKRMEQLDAEFANRYLKSYEDYKKGNEITNSWETAFAESKDKSLIVLQHLLLGMNAHINLDLGIAATEISTQSTLHNLQNDFNKINDILSSMVDEVQNDLAKIWPMLLKILKWAKKVDDFLIGFSMNLARDGAWKFANELIVVKNSEKENLISIRDQKISELAGLVTNHGIVGKIIFTIIRFGERGNPSNKIKSLVKEIKTQ